MLSRRKFVAGLLALPLVKYIVPVEAQADIIKPQEYRQLKDDLFRVFSENSLFEINNKETREKVRNKLQEVLNYYKSDRKIYEGFVICDERNNTPADIDNNSMFAEVMVKPSIFDSSYRKLELVVSKSAIDSFSIS